MPVEELDLLERLEDELDLRAVRAAKDDPTEPWEKVKEELGFHGEAGMEDR